VVYVFLLIVESFADLYWIMGTTANFSVELSRWGAIYFALGTLTTAGTGTIAPTSDFARALVSGQMLLDLGFVTYVLGIAVARWGERPS
jgi:voltage-gated potassium channel